MKTTSDWKRGEGMQAFAMPKAHNKRTRITLATDSSPSLSPSPPKLPSSSEGPRSHVPYHVLQDPNIDNAFLGVPRHASYSLRERRPLALPLVPINRARSLDPVSFPAYHEGKFESETLRAQLPRSHVKFSQQVTRSPMFPDSAPISEGASSHALPYVPTHRNARSRVPFVPRGR